MELNFNRARKLIDQLEEKLHATSTHTVTAREVLNLWLESGEHQMRKKSAAALKQVRKKADGFAKALTKLEENLSKSLVKLSKEIEQSGGKKPSPKPTSSRTPKGKKALVSINKVAKAPQAPQEIARPKPPSRAVVAQNRRVQAHTSSRGRKSQAKRDSK